MTDLSDIKAKADRVLEGLTNLHKPTPEQVQGAIVSYASAFLGMSEIGSTNRNELIDAWAKELGYAPANPWCLIFIQHVFLGVSGAFGRSDLLPRDTASTQQLADWAEKQGLSTIVTDQAEPGSIIVFRDGASGLGHAEIITSVGECRYSSIGGNTNSEFSRDGGDVGEHRDVAWARFGPVGSARGGKKRWTRGIIPVSRLMSHSWGVTSMQ